MSQDFVSSFIVHYYTIGMKNIREEIKQDVFESNFQMAYINAIYTANYLNDQTKQIFKKYGLLQQHFNVLRILNGRKGETVSPGEIIEVMLDKGRDLTRLIDKLERLGLVSRLVNKLNRRKVDLRLTDQGAEILEKLNNELYEQVYKAPSLNEDEAAELSRLLDKMRS